MNNQQESLGWSEKEKDYRTDFNEKFDQYAFEFPRLRGEIADYWLYRMKIEIAKAYKAGRQELIEEIKDEKEKFMKGFSYKPKK